MHLSIRILHFSIQHNFMLSIKSNIGILISIMFLWTLKSIITVSRSELKKKILKALF